MIKALFVLLFACSFSRIAHAQFFTGPAASAAGSSGRAAVDPGEAAFLNPAGVAFLHRYNTSFYYGTTQQPVEGTSNIYGVSLADGSEDSIVAGALSYIRKINSLPDGSGDTQQDIQVSLAAEPIQKLAIGLSAHRLSDQVLSNISGNEYDQYNATLGAIYTPFASFGVGAVAYDILPFKNDGVPVAYHVAPTFALAGNYVYEKAFRARLDLIRPDTNNPGRRTNIAAGVETFFAEFFAFRFGGYWRETADQTYVSAGIGYLGPKLSIDYSFQQDVRNGYNYRHLIDLWLPL